MNEKVKLLKRYFSNKYSRYDYIGLKNLILSPENELEELMNQHWDEFKNEDVDSQKDLTKILSMFEPGNERKVPKPFFKKFVRTFSRVAAILILPLFLAVGFLFFQFNEYLFQKNVYVEVSSPTGSRTHLNLPDGSDVWLNGDSHIRYPAVFNNFRKVEIDGEAFFKVKSDKEHPFLVTASEIVVQATGTEFNVLAYGDEAEISVILKDGKVAVLDSHQSELKEMEAGYQLNYLKKNGTIHYSEINADDYSGWINGRLIFRNASMREVVSRMERWYGIDIEIVDKELLQLHFRATFIHENIEEAFKLLQSTATFNYHFAKRQTREDGSYGNTKIFITKN